MRTRHISPRGFTLIELLIVIAIILILIAIALPNFLEAQIRARVAKAQGDLSTAATAIESFRIDYGFYPPDGGWQFHSNQAPLVNPLMSRFYPGNAVLPPPLEPPNYWRLDHHFWLTTPIEYLSDPIDEPFSSSNSVSSEPAWWEGSFVYVNQEFSARAAGDPGLQSIPVLTRYTSNPIQLLNGRQRVSWLLFSIGPNQRKDHPENYSEYNPTNGTKSEGDIYRAGP